MTAPLRMLVASGSDTGLCRPRNEDAVASLIWAEPGDTQDDAMILAVADGMGGTAGGEVASSLTLGAVEQVLSERRASRTLTEQAEWFDAFGVAFARAVSAMADRASQDPELSQMGTTLTCLAVHRGQIMFGHVGDSRAYLFRAGVLRQLTTDHNAAAELVSAGRLTPSEALTHKSRYVLTRWLAPDAGLIEAPESGSLAAEPGDVLLLCSDGLHGMVSDDEIAAVLGSRPMTREADLNAAAHTLIARANAHGGKDNISAALGLCAFP